MTGYQETLTDPSYHRQVVVQTAPHIGNTGVNDEDARVAPDLGRRLRRARPGPPPSNWRSRRSLDDELAAQGVVGISGIDTRALTRHLRERGAMRCGVSRASTPTPTALLAQGAGLAADGRRRPVGRGHDARAVPRRRDRRAPVHRRRARLRHQVDDAAPDGRARHHHRTCCRRPSTRRRGRSPPAPTRCSSPTARATRPPPTPRSPPCASCCAARSRSSASASATRCSAGRSGSAPTSSATATAASTSRCRTARTGKVEITAHNHGFAVDAPLDRADRRPSSARSRSATSASTTTSSRACAPATRARSACSTTPRPRPARTTRPTCSTGSSSCSEGTQLMPKRTDIEHILVIGSGPIVIGQACEFDYSGHPGLPGAAQPRATGSAWSTPTRRRS